MSRTELTRDLLQSINGMRKGESMKKAYLLLAIGLLLTAVAVAGIDFSGTWVFNAMKSDQPPAGSGGGGNLTIHQTGTLLTISRTWNKGENTENTSYTIDGAEHTNRTTQQGDTRYKAVLSGNSVHITGTTSSQSGDQPVDTTYALSDDGKILTVTGVNLGQNGTTARKQVYDKRDF
jgi:hypothetical protein